MKIIPLALIASFFITLNVNAYDAEYREFVDEYNKEKQEFLELKQRAENGDPSAQAQLANIYIEGRPPGLEKNFKKAYKWYEEAAENGDMESQYVMGGMLMESSEGFLGLDIKTDNKKALKYLEMAAEQGHKEAQSLLLSLNFTGEGLVKKRDLAEAYKWAGLAVGEGENKDEDMEKSLKELENMMTPSELNRAKNMLKHAIRKRDANR